MDKSRKEKGRLLQERILFYESAGFLLLMAWSWLDEIYDLPAKLFGGAPSPPNIVEAVEESVVIFIFGLIVVCTTHRLLKRIRLLEGIVPTCAFCKKIRANEQWHAMEEFFSKRSDVEFSHSFCPDCTKEHYGIDIEEGNVR